MRSIRSGARRRPGWGSARRAQRRRGFRYGPRARAGVRCGEVRPADARRRPRVVDPAAARGWPRGTWG